MFGNKLKISIFGQSHSLAIGICIDGLPSGLKFDFEELNMFMQRRAPGQASHTSGRQEPDAPEFISGLVEGMTCGAPLTAIIRNVDARPSDYKLLRDIPRPSHADYAAHVKYGASRDYRGGGQFSGRLTAPLCVAGGICMQLLRQQNVYIGAHIRKIGNIADSPFDMVNVSPDELRDLRKRSFPVLDVEAGEQMRDLIEEARNDGDSVGGIVECCAIGIPAGIGEPMFDGIENHLAAILFGIPAVKGVEFGNGFAAAGLRGSENNDAFYMNKGTVQTRTNRHGGILGGITSGMPILFRVAFKPTPSIAKPQKSVSLTRKEDVDLIIEGRHDPCIVPRTVPCVEAAAAVALYDMMLENNFVHK
jgi:chorismate synthase